jgi:hypothetical protein
MSDFATLKVPRHRVRRVEDREKRDASGGKPIDDPIVAVQHFAEVIVLELRYDAPRERKSAAAGRRPRT